MMIDDLHPGRLTWNLQITHLERKMIFQTSMIMFHVNLQGCKNNLFSQFQRVFFLVVLDTNFHPSSQRSVENTPPPKGSNAGIDRHGSFGRFEVGMMETFRRCYGSGRDWVVVVSNIFYVHPEPWGDDPI